MSNSGSLASEQTAIGGDLDDTTIMRTFAEPAPAKVLDRLHWQQRQEQYWGEISTSYDDLYQSKWSRFENAWVSRRLSFVRELAWPTVIDLGCGTGLGRRLLRDVNPAIRYVGVDISAAMARLTADPEDDAKVIVGAMDDLSALADDSADVVIALFTSLSFAYDTSAVLTEVGRVLRAGGHAYLSALSATSRSWVTRRTVREGVYRTRGDLRPGAGVPVRLIGVHDMRRHAAAAGLTTVSVAGMNSMSGALEIPQLWYVGRFVARLVPATAHTLEFHLRKFG